MYVYLYVLTYEYIYLRLVGAIVLKTVVSVTDFRYWYEYKHSGYVKFEMCCNCCCFCVSRLTMNCLWCPYFATRHTGKYTKLTKLLSRWRHRKKLRQTTITTHYWLSLSRVKCVKIRRKIGILVLMLLSVQTETLLALFVCIGEFESEVKENAQIRAKS